MIKYTVNTIKYDGEVSEDACRQPRSKKTMFKIGHGLRSPDFQFARDLLLNLQFRRKRIFRILCSKTNTPVKRPGNRERDGGQRSEVGE
jgi:hypothetical protein